MKLLYIFILSAVCSVALSAQSITGSWHTYDDETNEKKALVSIYEQDNRLFAKIIKSYISDSDALCEKCKGDKKGNPIAGLIIIEDMMLQEDDQYSDGTILDPENGKVYRCNLQLGDDGRLKVRGYIGFSLIGRTQYWKRAE